MQEMRQFILFSLDQFRFALPLSHVRRVIQAVEVTPVPRAPVTVKGVVNIQGKIVPVVNTRKLFGLSDREIEPTDHLILFSTSNIQAALLTDDVHGIITVSEQQISKKGAVLSDIHTFCGVVKQDGKIVYIQDPETFLSFKGEKELFSAIIKKGDHEQKSSAIALHRTQ